MLEDRRLMVTNIWNPNVAVGNWDSAANWSQGWVPRADEDVKIGGQSVVYRNVSGQSPIIKSLTTEGPFEVNGTSARLRIAGAFNSTSNVSLKSAGDIDAAQFSTTGSLTLGANTSLNLPQATGILHAGGGIVMDATKPTLMNAVISATTSITISTGSAILENVTINGQVSLTGTNAGVTIRERLTLNSTLTLGIQEVLSFAGGTATLSGTGTVVLANKSANGIELLDNGMTLIIGPNMTVRGGNTQGGTSYVGNGAAGVSTATLRIEGKIIADPGMTISICDRDFAPTPFANTLQIVNPGSLHALGTLGIAGKFSSVDAAKITRSNGGTINLLGQVDNTGQNWNLPNGPWNFVGGEIIGGTITQTTTNRLIFTNKGGTLDNVRIDGDVNIGADSFVAVQGNLTLASGTLTLNDRARIYFDSTIASLLGNGTVVFLENASSGLITRQNGMTLTIGKDITVRGGHTLSLKGFIGNFNGWELGNGQGLNTTVRIEGKIIADLPGRQIGLRPTNRLINVGLIEAKAGIVALDGIYTREELGVVKNSEGGIIKVDGTLENQGKTLSFDNVSGSWSLMKTGTIVGGTVLQGTNRLLLTSAGGTLDGVTITGDIDLSADQTQVDIVNGLTLNGKATLGKGSTITFLGDQTLGGRADIFFQNVSNNALNLKGKNMTLTIGPDVVISGGGDHRGSTSAIVDITVGASSPTVILNGTILASNSIPSGAIQVNLPGGQLVANGRLESQGGDVRILQSMTLPEAGTMISPSSGAMTFGGNVSFSGRDPNKILLLGTNNFTGSSVLASPQLLEGLSQDLGANSNGFSRSNYLLGTLVVKGNTKMRLVDLVDNAPVIEREAVYVNSLVIEANANLNVGNLNLYYRSLTILGTGNSRGTISTDLGGTHQLVKGGGDLPFNLPTPGTIDSVQKNHDWTFQGTQGGWVNLNASPGAGLWLRMRLFDAADNLLWTATSAAAGAAVTLSNYILPRNGLYRVAIDADPLHASVGTYVVTLIDSTPNRRVANIAITSNQVQGVEYGAAVEFTARMTAQAPTAPKVTGTVQFKVDGVAIGGPVSLVDGVAKLLLSLPGAGARIVTVDFVSDNGSFDANSSGFIQQIKRKVLVMKANDILQRVAGTAFTLQYTAIGFVPGEDAQVLTGTPVLSVDPAATNSVGSYTINISLGTLAASNYSFQFTTAMMTVIPSLPFRMDIVSGGNQKVIINRALPLLQRLKVLDEFRNPIPNATVVFTAPISGSSGIFAGGQTSVSINTSDLGEAQAPTFTVNDIPGNFSITATSNGIVSNFQVTIAEAGAPLEFIPLSGALSETAGIIKISLQRNTIITSALTVNLTSSHPEFVDLPISTITFPVNVDTVLFDARIVNDNIASGLIGSGPKDIEILATATNLPSTTLQVQVSDDDVAALTLQLSPTIQEGDKTVATLSRNTSTAGELAVRLTAGDSGVLNVPTVITIPAGQRTVVFDVQSVADQLAFGARTTSLSADAMGMTSAKVDVSVTDSDSPALILEPINSTDVSEKDGSTTFRLRRNSPPTSSLAVGIQSPVTNVVNFLPTVVIPEGSLFVDFTVAPINDTLAGSDRNITITASAGQLSSTKSMVIREDDAAALIMTLDANTLIEGSNSSSFNVTLYRNTLSLPALTVDIAASLPGQVLLSNQVTFFAGDANAFFVVSAIDDTAFEGLHSIRLTARATGFTDALSDHVTIEDNETLSLSTSTTVLSEKDGQVLFTITRNIINTDQPLLVSLLSTDTSELAVPLLVTIPANATSITFFATGVDDALLDGSQSVQVLASASGYVASSQSSASISVSDQELLTVQLDTDTIDEAAGKVQATITRSDIDDLSQALTVTLVNSADSRVQFPSNSVTIPAGESSITIEGTAIDNTIYEGDKIVTLTASAAGYTSGSASATVLEQDLAWHNYRNALDVNDDGSVTALDALIIINRLNTLSGELQLGVDEFVDTSADDRLSPIDALLVINELNKPKSPEGERATDGFFSDYAADNWLELENRSRQHKIRTGIPQQP